MIHLNEKVGVGGGWKTRAVPAICYRMLLGMNAGRLTIPEHEFDLFVSKYRDLIETLLPYMPDDLAAIDAALVKCAIAHNPKKVMEFCDNSKKLIFNGKNDPAFHFHHWGFTGKKRGPRPTNKSVVTYSTALNLCSAYCEGRTLIKIRPLKIDLFEWDDNYNPILKNKSK